VGSFDTKIKRVLWRLYKEMYLGEGEREREYCEAAERGECCSLVALRDVSDTLCERERGRVQDRES
jgi:hypothetical protein